MDQYNVTGKIWDILKDVRIRKRTDDLDTGEIIAGQ